MKAINKCSFKGFLLGGILLSFSSFSNADFERQVIKIEHEFNQSPDYVWKNIGGFCSIKYWQSVVQDCVVTEKEDGIYRLVTMQDSTVFVERLESYSQDDMEFSYSIKYGPVDLDDYLSSIKIVPLRGERSKLIWNVSYVSNDNDFMKQNLYSLFQNGITGMERLININSKDS